MDSPDCQRDPAAESTLTVSQIDSFAEPALADVAFGRGHRSRASRADARVVGGNVTGRDEKVSPSKRKTYELGERQLDGPDWNHARDPATRRPERVDEITARSQPDR
jgi:uncharacterized protein YjlB